MSATGPLMIAPERSRTASCESFQPWLASPRDDRRSYWTKPFRIAGPWSQSSARSAAGQSSSTSAPLPVHA
jgi:hypothetical protein